MEKGVGHVALESGEVEVYMRTQILVVEEQSDS
jgi:hypothetical protein